VKSVPYRGPPRDTREKRPRATGTFGTEIKGRPAYAAAKSALSTSETNGPFSLIFDYQFKIA